MKDPSFSFVIKICEFYPKKFTKFYTKKCLNKGENSGLREFYAK
ncbi:hypothetical protein [Campylobacter troglodytis]|nr:hypothetical protein [Campylobacter troglodytis]